eukprot:TRINITY_DN17471_c0_g1_i1.p1 TRINITY_DN17471_c0_g1~~TRINITY_DN17471_c0_g1_i1.p1  ORF type:complete len:352 (+),score=63.14 TRINITY_DN17471_c0_g1_i1:49-1104(+)
MKSFRALIRSGKDAQAPRLALKEFASLEELPKQDPKGEVTIKVSHSTINYKDAMVMLGQKGVASFPVVPGIDAAGTVVDSSSPEFKNGDEVLITGNKIGQGIDGGMAEYCRVQAGWLVHKPESLTSWDVMALGSAGITAMMCIDHLEQAGGLVRFKNTDQPVLVTGAGGGLGSIAVSLLSSLGYHVVASTGRVDTLTDYLKGLGATEVIGRLELEKAPLNKQKWCGVIDAVGGDTLSTALSQTKYRCAVASTGVAGGGQLNTTVYPFILRGIRLLGVDSTMPWNCPGYETDPDMWQFYRNERQHLWARLSTELNTQHLQQIATTIKLSDLTEDVATDVINGKVRGRYVVEI